MDDIFGRKLHIGDYVLTKPCNKGETRIDIKAFAIVVASDRVYNGSEFKADPCYLIENLAPVDIENKKKLEESYAQYVTIQLNRKKMLQKKNNEKNKLLKEVSIKRGDVFLYKSYYWVLLGYCQVKYNVTMNTEIKELDKTGYTYMRLPIRNIDWTDNMADLTRLKDKLFNVGEVSFKTFNYKNSNQYNNDFKQYSDKNLRTILYEANESILVSSKLSTRFMEPIVNVKFTDFDYENDMYLGGIFYSKYKKCCDIIYLKYLHD